MGNASIRGTENAVLWAEMGFHVFSALIIGFGSLMLHWNLGSPKRMAGMVPGTRLLGKKIGKKFKSQLAKAIDRWQGPYGRIFRQIAHMVVWVNIILAISSAMLALSLFEFERDDDVIARPVRFLAYSVVYTIMSVAMSTFSEIELGMMFTWIVPSSLMAMLTGWAISYLTHFTQANVLFSTFAMIFLPMVPLMTIAGTPFQLLKSLRRFLPLILHYLIGISFWVIFWVSPQSNPNVGDHAAINLTESIVYFVMEVVWVAGMMTGFYLINMGEYAKLRKSTDVIQTEVTGDVRKPTSLRGISKTRTVTNSDPTDKTKYDSSPSDPEEIFKNQKPAPPITGNINPKSAWSKVLKQEQQKKHMVQSKLRRSSLQPWSSSSQFTNFD